MLLNSRLAVLSLFVLAAGCGTNSVLTASAGADQTVAAGGTVTLDASASKDSANNPLTYSWSQTSGQAVQLSSNHAVQPTFTAPAVTSNTTLVFQVSVSNGKTATGASTTVTITPAAGGPVAVINAPATAASGATVTLDGSGSTGTGLSYAWAQTAGTSVTLSSISSATTTFTAPTVTTATTLSFELAVADTNGNVGRTTWNISITPGGGNQPPTAVATASPTSVHSGDNVTLSSTGSADPNSGGSVTGYAWTQTGGSPTATLTGAGTATASFTAPTETSTATLTFSLVVTDNFGLSSTAATATVTVVPLGQNVPPTAVAGASPSSIGSGGGTVTLNSTGSTDPNAGGSITGWAWTQTGGSPTVTLTGANTATATFSAPTVTSTTTLTFSLVVTDNFALNSTAATATVTVTAAHTAPTAVAGASPSSIASGGGTVTLNSSGSTDPNAGGSITGWAWSQTVGPTVTLSSTTVASPTFSAPTVTSNTTLTFSLKVTDNFGLQSAAATTSVTVTAGGGGNNIKQVFVVAMENTTASLIYGNTTDAPYVNNTLMATYGWATNYNSNLHPSEPNYVFMEAGTNSFSDTSFTTDDTNSIGHSTAETKHLVTQMGTAGVTWMAYQEDMPSGCPVSNSGLYAAKHDPFVWFQDVAGNPPSSGNSNCSAHHKDYATNFATDLGNNAVAKYNFITPNLCHVGHGASGCGATGSCASCSTGGSHGCICQADAWMSQELPRIVNYVNANQGLLIVLWDEGGSGSNTSPVLVIGPNVIHGADGTSFTSHAAFTKTIGEIFSLPPLATTAGATDFASFFTAGKFP